MNIKINILRGKLAAANMLRAAIKLAPSKITKSLSAHRALSAPLLESLKKSSISAGVCHKNYEADWQKALSSDALQLPIRKHVDEQGNPSPIHCFGGVLYLPEGSAKNSLVKVKDELLSMLPKIFFRTPDQFMHMTAFILTKPNITTYPGYTKHWTKSISDICINASAPRFKIIGVNITREGIIYAKGYPVDDSFQNIRNIENGLFPASIPKDVFNITLGRAYKPLSGAEWKKTVSTIERYFKNLYIGEIRPNIISLGNFEGSGIPDINSPFINIVMTNNEPVAPIRPSVIPGSSADHFFLDQTIALAAKGEPEHLCKVAAMVVKGDQVLGSAYKFKRQMMHSEILAIIDVIKSISKKDQAVMDIAKVLLDTKYHSLSEEQGGIIKLRRMIWETVNAIKEKTGKNIFDGTTIYVNLEPCDPSPGFVSCSEVIERSGIRRVVVATTDSGLGNKEGYGLKYLQNSGVEVILMDELTAKARKMDSEWFQGKSIEIHTELKKKESIENGDDIGPSK